MTQTKFKQTEIGMIPEDWEVGKIKDLCEKTTSGGTPLTNHAEYYDGDIPWLRTQEVTFGRIYQTEKKITKIGLDNSSAKLIPKNSVIVAMYGATAGKVAINKISLSTNQACCNLIIKHKLANYEYIYYYLMNNYKWLVGQATGAAQQNLSVSQISNIKIPLPPILEQSAIAKILSDLDSKIELLQKQNETLEKIGQAIFKHWFVDFEFPNEEGKPYKSSGGEMIESELGEIPKGWSVASVESLSIDISDGNYSSKYPTSKDFVSKKGIFFISPKDFSGNTINFNNLRQISKKKHLELKKGHLKLNDILLVNRGEIGKLILLNDSLIGSNINAQLVRLNDKNKIGRYYLYNFLSSFYGKSQIFGFKKGSALQQLTIKDINNINILIPLNNLNLKYNILILNIYNQRDNNLEEINYLQKTRDLLLPKLMTGKIRVPLEAEE